MLYLFNSFLVYLLKLNQSITLFMKKQITHLCMLVLLAAFTGNCAKKQVSQSSMSTDSQTQQTQTNTTATATEPASAYMVYAGKYKMQSNDIDFITIMVEGNRVFGQAPGQPKTEIKPDGKDTFNVPDFNAKIIFTRDSNQKVNGLTLYINGAEVSGSKVE